MIIEELVIKYLSDDLGINAYAETPKQKTKEYILIKKMDGGRTNHINASTLSIVSHAGSFFETAKLHEKVKASMLNIVSMDEVSSCKIGGESESNDKEHKEYGYELIVNLYHY